MRCLILLTLFIFKLGSLLDTLPPYPIRPLGGQGMALLYFINLVF